MLLELDGVRADPHVLVVEVAREVLVDAVADALAVGDHAVGARLPVGDVQRVRQHVQDCEVVFDDQHRPVALLGEFPDQPRDGHALADVQIGGDLVEEVKVRVPGQCGGGRDPLEFPTGEVVDRLVEHRPDRQSLDQFLERAALVGSSQEFLGGAVELVGDPVDVLWLARDRHLAVPDCGDVVLEFGATERLQHLVPVRGVVVAAEVGHHLARQRVDGGGLTDPVGAQDTGDLALLGNRQAVQREGVLAEPVGRLLGQFLGQVDDLDGVERALLDADPAGLPQAYLLADPHLVWLAVFGVLAPEGDALLAGAVRRAVVLALVVAPVRLAPVQVDDRDGILGHITATHPWSA